MMSRSRKHALVLAAAFATMLANAQAASGSQVDLGANLPNLGNEAFAVVSPQQEKQLGADFMRYARHDLNIIHDPELNEYIEALGQKLVAHTSDAGQRFHFFIINDPTINSFSVPGGYIGVDAGLILTAHSESELAAVLSHEITHVIQHHVIRGIAESKRLSLPAMGAMLAGLVLAASGSANGGMATVALSSAAVAQTQLDHSRAYEAEADRIGMQTLNAAGYNAVAMPRFFERMATATRFEPRIPGFLSDHPTTTDRITYLTNEAAKFPHHPPADNTAFFDAQAEVRVIASNDPDELVNYYRRDLRNGDYLQKDADQYGYALALARDQQLTPALREIDGLVQRHPHYLLFRLAQAEIEMSAGHYTTALGHYAVLLRTAPDDLAVMERYAAALLETGHAQQARTLLHKALRKDPDSASLYKMLAVAAGDSGRLLESHRALAEHYYLDGNAPAAIEQLTIARRYAGHSYYYLSSLDARIKEIKRQAALDKHP
ncbi:MAG: M48 family metalloprotease [Gammaproteobacteria bacterium]|nr:M48 family metalloprotease [Gammaproteobacteria bacterium]